MLVRALQIRRRPPPVRVPWVVAVFQREGVGRAGIEPDVEDVLDLLVVGRVVVDPEEARDRAARTRRRRPPRSMASTMRALTAVVLSGLARALVDEHGERRAPGALAADQPVGPGLDHRRCGSRPAAGIEGGGVDGVPARSRAGCRPCALVGQRLVHGDEPLRRVAEDHRRLGAPGVRVLVLQPAAGQERPGLDQLVDHRVVGAPELALASVSRHPRPRTAARAGSRRRPDRRCRGSRVPQAVRLACFTKMCSRPRRGRGRCGRSRCRRRR